MSDSFSIDEVVRRTGLTSSALRFCEARGLISPVRTQSGRRWFGPAELERIHRIVALKKAGLSQGDIKRLFDHEPIDLSGLLSAQRIHLTAQAYEIADAITLIDTALSRIDPGEPLPLTLHSSQNCGNLLESERSNMKIRSIILLSGLLAASAQASTPQGAMHGSWHVISIISTSGVGGNDAAVLITQKADGDELTARWEEGGRIVMSIDINECFNDQDFEQSYAIPLSTWQALSIGARARHLKITFGTWIEQAQLSCTKRNGVEKFQLGLLKRASNDFNRRLDYFAPRDEPTTASGN
jgi:DNA-binding transcriptional MerR regulator